MTRQEVINALFENSKRKFRMVKNVDGFKYDGLVYVDREGEIKLADDSLCCWVKNDKAEFEEIK